MYLIYYIHRERMSQEIHLEDFLPAYAFLPDVLDHVSDYPVFDIYHDTYDNVNVRKKEFYQSQLEITESRPDRPGIPLKHQSFLAKFLSPRTLNDEMLLFHGMGTGKTCSVIMTVEQARAAYPSLRPTLVLVRGETLKRNFIKELVFKCTKGEYLPTDFDTLTNEEKTRRINKLVNKNYEFSTFETFVTHTIDAYTDEQLKKLYSNRYIIIDEAQHLRLHAQASAKKHLDIYKSFHRFLHVIENCKKLLLSGTPMVDRPEELAGQMNLLLPLSSQLPTGTKFLDEYFFKGQFRDEKKDGLRSLLQGRISYLRSMESSVIKIREGEVMVPLQKLPVVKCEMSEFQRAVYLDAYSQDVGQDVEGEEHISSEEGEQEGKETGLYDKSRQASMFVFPDQTYGADGFRSGKWIRQQTKTKLDKDGKMKKIQTNQFSLTKEFIDLLTDHHTANTFQMINNISLYSCKFAYAIQEILQHPHENIFVYSKFVYGSGAILFGKLLELVGFERTRARESIEEKSVRESKQKEVRKERYGKISREEFDSMLEKEEKAEKERETEKENEERDEKEAKNRYAIMTGETSGSTEIERILDTFNSPENKHGQLIRVVIGSQIIGEGKSLRNVRRILILTPHWNMSETEQAIARGIRAFSHDDLLKQDQNVHVYRLVAWTPQLECIDLRMYKVSEDKDRLIKPLERICKESAVDCALNIKRNQLESDTDGSRECDYQSCSISCLSTSNLQNPDLITDTYSLFYAEDTLERLVGAIKQLFRVRFACDLSEIYLHLPDISPMVIVRALTWMIDQSLPIKNRFGLVNYLREDHNLLFLVDTIDSIPSFAGGYYAQTPTLEPHISFTDAMLLTEYSSFPSILHTLQTLSEQKNQEEKIKEIVSHLHPSIQEWLYEMSVVADLEHKPNHVALRTFLLSLFQAQTFSLEDQSYISRIQEPLYRCLPASYIQAYQDTEDESHLKWEDCQGMIQSQITGQKQHQKQSVESQSQPYGCYGKLGLDRKFRIKFLDTNKSKDKRKVSTGIVSDTMSPNRRIFEILVRVHADPPSTYTLPGNQSKAELIKKLLLVSVGTYTHETLFDMSPLEFRRIYYWYTQVDRKHACRALQTWFESHGLLVYDDAPTTKRGRKKE